MDLVVDGHEVRAVPGGAPFNVARACARLGVEVALWSTVSTDGFGARLIAALEEDGVDLDLIQRVDAPTPLALAEISGDGSATYRFYLAATALVGIPGDHRRPSDTPGLAAGVMVTGGLALVIEPLATQIGEMLATARSGVNDRPLIVIDVNARPDAFDDRAAALGRIEQLMTLADVVKLSDEDADVLWPNHDAKVGVASLLAAGVSLVILTAGSDPVQIYWATGSTSVSIPDLPGPLLDTIGAGDAFVAGLVTWWATHGVGPDRFFEIADEPEGPPSTQMRIDDVIDAVRAASIVAGVVCTRRGADAPHLEELPRPW